MTPATETSATTPPCVRPLPWLVALVLAGILALHLFLVARGAGLYRDQHLGAALNYAVHGVDLLHPVIVGFNATGTPTPLEFPLWQAATGLVLRVGGTWWGWGNIVAWLCFASCLWPFHRLAADALGPRAAWWSVLALLLQPLIVLNAGQAGTDGTAFAASIWFVYTADRMLRSGSWWWWAAAAIVGAVSATQKVPFFMAAGVATIGLLWQRPDRYARHWLQLVLAGGFAAAAFFLWTRHTERQLALAEFPLLDLRLSANPAMADWYFGSWAYRLDPVTWLRGGYRVLQGVCGSFPVVLLVLAGLPRQRQTLARWWLAGAFAATLVYCHLVLFHWHYYLMLGPAFALLCGGMLAEGEALLARHSAGCARWLPWLGAAGLALACVQGSHGAHFFLRDDHVPRMAALLARHTTAQDRVLVANGGWGGAELLVARRDGLSIVSTQFLETPGALARLRALGYTKLAALSQSPKRAAVSLLGGSALQRTRWPELLTPVTRDWPVIYRDDDICLLQIPAAPGHSAR